MYLRLDKSISGQTHKRGMTLMEILIVISLIILLLSISSSSYSRLKNQARAVQCTSKLREIGVGINLYLADNGLYFPTLAAGRDSKDDQEAPVLETELLDYVSNEHIFECPADHEGLFEKTGSSYFWNTLVNGQRMGNMNLLGIIKQEAGIPLVSDKENFHKHIGNEVNILYADGHILKELQFNVEMDTKE